MCFITNETNKIYRQWTAVTSDERSPPINGYLLQKYSNFTFITVKCKHVIVTLSKFKNSRCTTVSLLNKRKNRFLSGLYILSQFFRNENKHFSLVIFRMSQVFGSYFFFFFLPISVVS